MKNLKCPKCKSENVVSFDNESLEHNNVENKVDNEIYVKMKCNCCNHTFTLLFELKNPIYL